MSVYCYFKGLCQGEYVKPGNIFHCFSMVIDYCFSPILLRYNQNRHKHFRKLKGRGYAIYYPLKTKENLANILQLVSVLCVDPDFVGHDSTARFDRHDSTERLPGLTQRSMKSRNHERRLEVVSNISPTFIREIARKLREQWL